jgi:hypothetical protein
VHLLIRHGLMGPIVLILLDIFGKSTRYVDRMVPAWLIMDCCIETFHLEIVFICRYRHKCLFIYSRLVMPICAFDSFFPIRLFRRNATATGMLVGYFRKTRYSRLVPRCYTLRLPHRDGYFVLQSAIAPKPLRGKSYAGFNGFRKPKGPSCPRRARTML